MRGYITFLGIRVDDNSVEIIKFDPFSSADKLMSIEHDFWAILSSVSNVKLDRILQISGPLL